MGAVEATELVKSYGSTAALDGLDLAVPEGTVYGLFGPNGAGKSTFVDVVLDYVRPDAGSVTVFGDDPRADLAAVHRATGVLPDGYDFVTGLSARRQLAYAIEAHGAAEDPTTSSRRSGWATSATTHRRSSRVACDSDSPSRRHRSGTRRCWSSTSRSAASTRRASTCWAGSSSDGTPREPPSSSPPT